MLIIDSDIIIWLLRGDIITKERFIKAAQISKGLLFITPIQAAEIHAGVRKKERLDVELFLHSFMCLSIDLDAGKLAGEYLNKYQKSHNVTLADAIIAACTKIHGLKLWTANKKHYPMLNKEDFLEEK